MAGILYGVGVGPGDPELMTLKAVRLIKENEIIALPGENPKETTAYKIAVAAVEELAEKQLLSLCLPMSMDGEVLKKSRKEAVKLLESYLDQGKNVVCLTLGDPTIYSTFAYLQEMILADGYQSELVSGVPSFCAAAAKVNDSLALLDESIHIYPGIYDNIEKLPEKGTCVFMKSGSKIERMKELLEKSNRPVYLVENCGLPDEKIYRNVDEIPERTGYFTILIAKEDKG